MYIKHTNHFINKANNFSVPVNSVLIIMGVRSLYTSTANTEGIAVTKERYDNCIHKTLPTKIITIISSTHPYNKYLKSFIQSFN